MIKARLLSKDEVHGIIAPFAMDAKVLREFDGFPILTSEKHIWIKLENDQILIGFAAIKTLKNGIVEFTSDYVLPQYRQKTHHRKLIAERIRQCIKMGVSQIKADCTKHSLGNYKRAGFTVVKDFKNWTKVERTL